MAKDDHYCYWVADRPCTSSASASTVGSLTLDGRRPRYSSQPPFSVAGTHLDSHEGRYTVDVCGWLSRGQGVVLVWR
jgi:hypothetical protein